MPSLYPEMKPISQNPILRGHDLRMLLPLQGLTILAVEDSRYACDALRLMCQRSGARLRRAETLAMADAHLRCYRPDVVIVDLGLPDGPGEELITRLTLSPSFHGQMPVVLGSSGDPDAGERAMKAGASGFLEKPYPRLEAFQSKILSQLSDMRQRVVVPEEERLEPDVLALLDDLKLAERTLHNSSHPQQREWLVGFLAGLARQSRDHDLAEASNNFRHNAAHFLPVADLLRERIARANAFAPPSGL